MNLAESTTIPEVKSGIAGRSLRLCAALGAALILALTVACATKQAAERATAERGAAAPPTLPATALVVDTTQVTVLPPHFFGLNVETVPSVLSYGNPRLVGALRSLSPASLSYPGELPANWWDWIQGTMRKEWIDRMPDDKDGPPETSLRTRLNDAAEFNLVKGGTPLQSFLDCCSRLGAEPFCTANVLNQKPEESAKWMTTTRALGRPVLLWELGRQLWRREYRGVFPSAADYIKAARAHAKAIRRVDPAAKFAVGVPAEIPALEDPPESGDVATAKDISAKSGATPVARGKADRKAKTDRNAKTDENTEIGRKATTDPETAEKEFIRSWVAELARENFYEAVAIDLNFALRVAPGTSSEFVHFAVCHQTLKRIASLLEENGERFRDKKIWVSEWNISMDSNAGFADSLLRALTLADMAIVLTGQSPQVQRIVYSDAAAELGLANGEKIRKDVLWRYEKTGKIAQAGSLKLRFGETPPSGRALALLGDLFARSDRKAALEIYRPPRLTPVNSTVPDPRAAKTTDVAARGADISDYPAALSAMALLGADGTLRIAVVNRSREVQPLRLVVNSKKMGGRVRARCLSGPELVPQNPALLIFAKPDQAPPPPQPVTLQTIEWPADRIDLPPYSFSIIETCVTAAP